MTTVPRMVSHTRTVPKASIHYCREQASAAPSTSPEFMTTPARYIHTCRGALWCGNHGGVMTASVLCGSSLADRECIVAARAVTRFGIGFCRFLRQVRSRERRALAQRGYGVAPPPRMAMNLLCVGRNEGAN